VPLGSTVPSAGPGVVPLPTTPGGATGGPTDPSTTTSGPTTDSGGSQSGESIDKAFSSDGGSLLANCNNRDKATIHDWVPAEGYVVKKTKPGPANSPP
jgi:hypothetical protein